MITTKNTKDTKKTENHELTRIDTKKLNTIPAYLYTYILDLYQSIVSFKGLTDPGIKAARALRCCRFEKNQRFCLYHLMVDLSP